jgi:hypothetical protein
LIVGEAIDKLGVRVACAVVVLMQAGTLILTHFANIQQDKVKVRRTLLCLRSCLESPSVVVISPCTLQPIA